VGVEEERVCGVFAVCLQCVCSMSQCVAVWHGVLQCVAVCCSVLQCVAVWHGVLQCVAVCCSLLQCVAVCCSVARCAAVTRWQRQIQIRWPLAFGSHVRGV